MDKEQVEEWKSVVGFEGLYEVSSHGNIRNCKTGKIQAKHLVGKGYVKADFYRGNVKTQTSVHRVVATAFHGEPKPKQQVNHKNGIKTDNRAENLEWVSKSENEIHSRYSLGNLCKRVLARNLSTGEELIFPSIAQAGDRLKILASAISKCVTGTMKTTHGWCFVHLENGHETFSDQVAAAILKATKPLEDQLAAAQEEIVYASKDSLRLLETVKYLRGIAERGEARQQSEDETVEQFVLGYVKKLENQLAKAEQRVAEWQPISTAPKNGQSYLAYSTEFVNQYWVTDKCNGMTHWMPLPKAPNGASS